MRCPNRSCCPRWRAVSVARARQSVAPELASHASHSVRINGRIALREIVSLLPTADGARDGRESPWGDKGIKFKIIRIRLFPTFQPTAKRFCGHGARPTTSGGGL